MKKQSDANKELNEFHLELVQETDAAILVETEFGDQEWIPKKLIEDFKDNKDGTCKFSCTERLAIDKGLI